MIKKIVPWLGVIVTLLLLVALIGPRMIGQSSAPPSAYRAQSEYAQQWNLPDTAHYDTYEDNALKEVSRDPVSTFGLDVHTASYANVRRFLFAGRAPHPGAVRIEELLNYFPPASGDMPPERIAETPLSVAYEMAPVPWRSDRALLWLSFLAESAEGNGYEASPPANLVFLVDVSGSMSPPERLPLVRTSLQMLVERMRAEDRVSIVTYSGSVGVALTPTSGERKATILSAIEGLQAGGGTAGGAGLALAYKQAEEAFIPGGVNRILLCTDGDFNLGVSSTDELTAFVARSRESGVTLSILGFGDDNLNDALMTRIAACGNGNYSYIDSLAEARKVLDEELAATFVTVAKDAKVQIEFNPANVRAYRQIGYEKRQLGREDFNDDRVDAGDLGMGKRVTVLYELELVGSTPSADPLRYAPTVTGDKPSALTADIKTDELAYLKIRWKEPGTEKSELVETPLQAAALRASFDEAGAGLRFFAAVAAYGQKLRTNPNLTDTSWGEIARWADESRGDDLYRAEFVRLVRLAEAVTNDRSAARTDERAKTFSAMGTPAAQ